MDSQANSQLGNHKASSSISHKDIKQDSYRASQVATESTSHKISESPNLLSQPCEFNNLGSHKTRWTGTSNEKTSPKTPNSGVFLF